MKIALFQGKSLVSLAIRFATRSCYSHAAFLFDAGTEKAAIQLCKEHPGEGPFKRLHFFSQGSVVEAWEGGVRNSLSPSSLHTTGTIVDIFRFPQPLSAYQERALLEKLDSQIGDPYSWWNVLRFLTRRPGRLDGSWFCSELLFCDLAYVGCELLRRVQPWEVPPHWLQFSPLLEFDKTILTRPASGR